MRCSDINIQTSPDLSNSVYVCVCLLCTCSYPPTYLEQSAVLSPSAVAVVVSVRQTFEVAPVGYRLV